MPVTGQVCNQNYRRPRGIRKCVRVVDLQAHVQGRRVGRGSAITSERGEISEERRSQWPSRPGVKPRRRGTALFTYLLDEDDDLAQAFDVRTRIAARQTTTVRVLDANVGACDLTAWFTTVGHGPGLLILDGLIAVETRVGDRTAMQLIGNGDLLQPHAAESDDLLEQRRHCRALAPTRLALLDGEFAERTRPWPQIGHVLLRRASKRIADVDVLRAITSQPRLEVRLVLLLWHLAARWGKVDPAGIRVSLPLTHRLLGELVAAERPSVTHALARLTHSGLVTGAAGDWHLHGTVEEHLESLIERASVREAG
jgi:CRP/FNR family cyclic AMP-dependent transcriptional regulator